MKERLNWWTVNVIMYVSMWLVGLFPLQILVAYFYRVEWQFPTREVIQALSGQYWAVVIIPPLFRFFSRVLIAFLGDIWIDIRNEWGLFTDWLMSGKVSHTTGARLRTILTMLGWIGMMLWTVMWIFQSLVTYQTATLLATIIWASIVTSCMQWLSKNRTTEEE